MTNTQAGGWVALRASGSASRIKRATRLALAVGIAIIPLLAATAARAQTYTVIHSFGGGKDGTDPYASLVAGPSDTLYGTATSGGGYGYGAVFALKASGAELVRYAFTGGSDGATPQGSLLRDEAGNFLGTAAGGGNFSATCSSSGGCGVVFSLGSGRAETVLYTFTGGADGASPHGGLVADAVGNLYGTTYGGGLSGGCNGYGCGVVFKVGAAGNETVIYTFAGPPDGAFPIGALILDSAGNVYGTTTAGGVSGGCFGYGCGVVFQVSPSGTETVLFTFTGGLDGGFPGGDLVRDADGNLYGTTVYGGGTPCSDGLGCGVVFKLDPQANETVLHSFSGGSDGAFANAGLTRDAGGNLYGTTIEGGDLSCGSGLGCGTVFKLSPTGNETVLHNFTGGADGALPQGGLVSYRGYLYGTTTSGGTYGLGVAFRLKP